MLLSILGPLEIQFLFGLFLSVGLGYIIGAERESRGKDAGISTHILVISGAMLFTLLSVGDGTNYDTRIAAQIVSGIGFLGAGLILKEGSTIKNLTTAASIWCAGALGMTIGFGFYVVALFAGILFMLVPRIPHIRDKNQEADS
ncbi:MgtC/SapB family protein [Patescibacteria group bacterium]|nr:MgtC/SapB family protein [Patescibacteria group bacterium]MBU1755369.1 MgtC/SapB family protein [Patescibacteria group bacterium]